MRLGLGRKKNQGWTGWKCQPRSPSIPWILGPCCLFFLSSVRASISQLESYSQWAYTIGNTCNTWELNNALHLPCNLYSSDQPAQSSSVNKGVLVSQTNSPNSSSIHTQAYVYPWTISLISPRPHGLCCRWMFYRLVSCLSVSPHYPLTLPCGSVLWMYISSTYLLTYMQDLFSLY